MGGVQNLDYTYNAQGFVESVTTHLNDSHLVGVTEGQDTFGYDTGTSHLTSISGPAPESLAYDANGNVTTKGNLSFIYDDNNRLVEVKDAGATVATYTYNGFSQRVKKVAAGETVIYHYDASGHLIAERTRAGLDSARARGRTWGRKKGLSEKAKLITVKAKALYEQSGQNKINSGYRGQNRNQQTNPL